MKSVAGTNASSLMCSPPPRPVTRWIRRLSSRFRAKPHFHQPPPYYDIDLPLGPDFGGPLFFSHYSFCGLDPRGLKDAYANYFQQNVQHALINHAHCIRNPNGHNGYGPRAGA